MATNTAAFLAERPPPGNIIPGKTFEYKTLPAPKEEDLKDGEILIEVLYLSVDPAMRGWLMDRRSYAVPVQIGDIMRGVTISRVLATKSSKFNKGDFVTCEAGWQEYAIVSEKIALPIQLPPGAKLTNALGVLGPTGMTAYLGLLKIGDPKPGDLVVVSGAAGATGSIVGQIAKIKGARVIGIAGADDKVKWLKEELGFDDALNYKDPNFEEKFKEVTKDYIDVFFDNVGGDILDAALARAKPFARFVMCGAISQYVSTTLPKPLKNLGSVITMRIKMQGFIWWDFKDDVPAARAEVAKWLGEGKIKTKETIIKGGIRAAEKGLMDLFRGANTGKLLVEINPEDGVAKL